MSYLSISQILADFCLVTHGIQDYIHSGYWCGFTFLLCYYFTIRNLKQWRKTNVTDFKRTTVVLTWQMSNVLELNTTHLSLYYVQTQTSAVKVIVILNIQLKQKKYFLTVFTHVPMGVSFKLSQHEKKIRTKIFHQLNHARIKNWTQFMSLKVGKKTIHFSYYKNENNSFWQLVHMGNNIESRSIVMTFKNHLTFHLIHILN